MCCLIYRYHHYLAHVQAKCIKSSHLISGAINSNVCNFQGSDLSRESVAELSLRELNHPSQLPCLCPLPTTGRGSGKAKEAIRPEGFTRFDRSALTSLSALPRPLCCCQSLLLHVIASVCLRETLCLHLCLQTHCSDKLAYRLPSRAATGYCTVVFTRHIATTHSLRLHSAVFLHKPCRPRPRRTTLDIHWELLAT